MIFPRENATFHENPCRRRYFLKTQKLQKIDAKTNRKNAKNEWKIESISMLIFKHLFSRILESTWLHFWGQVETQKTDRLRTASARGLQGVQERPKRAQERPKRAQEPPKSDPRGVRGDQNLV